jgi:hypothetical protein
MAIPFSSSSSFGFDAFTFRRVSGLFNRGPIQLSLVSLLPWNFGERETDIPHHPHAAAIKLRKKERERVKGRQKDRTKTWGVCRRRRRKKGGKYTKQEYNITKGIDSLCVYIEQKY